MGLHELRGQSVALGAEDQHVVGAERHLADRCPGAGREQAQPLPERSGPALCCEMSEAGVHVRVNRQVHQVPVVQTRAPHPALVQAEPQGFDEVQVSSEGRGQAADRARVLGDLGVDEDDVHGVRVAALDLAGARRRANPDS